MKPVQVKPRFELRLQQTKDHTVKLRIKPGLELKSAYLMEKKINNSLRAQILDKYLPYIRLSLLYWRKLQLESALC